MQLNRLAGYHSNESGDLCYGRILFDPQPEDWHLDWWFWREFDQSLQDGWRENTSERL